jgi:hypothetical protein
MLITEFYQSSETILEICFDSSFDPQKQSALSVEKVLEYSFVTFLPCFLIAVVINAIFIEFSPFSLLGITLLIELLILCLIFWYRSNCESRYIIGIIVDSEKKQILEKFWQKDRYCYELIVPTSRLWKCKYVNDIDRAADEVYETEYYYYLSFVSRTDTNEMSEIRYGDWRVDDKNGPEIARRINKFLGILA